MKRTTLTAAATAGLAVTALALTGCGSSSSADESAPKVLTLGIVGTSTYDPPNMTSAGEGLLTWQGVYDTLLIRQSDGELSPGLAEEWSWDDSLTTLTLELRDGVTFSDDTPFDADAVKANFDHFLATPGYNTSFVTAIDDVVVVDDDTVQINLTQPDPGLEFSLSNVVGAMVSPTALESPDLTQQPVGTGPYVLDLDRTDPQAELVFTRRDGDHWNAGAWVWDEIDMKVMSDQAARINALRAGEIDGTVLTAQAVAEVESGGATVLKTPGDFVGLGLFDRDGVVQPALADVRVRQAINHAFDREAMLEGVQLGYGRITADLFPGIDPIDGTDYDYDPEKAKELLAEAGYADGLTLTGVDYGNGSPVYAIVTDALAQVGIDMVWQSVAPTDAVAEMFSGKYPAFNAVWNGTVPWSMISSTVGPSALWNVFKNDPPELAALIETIRTTSGAEQEEAYGKLDGWLSTNAWFAPYYQLDWLYALSPDVQAETAPNATPFLWSFKPAE